MRRGGLSSTPDVLRLPAMDGGGRVTAGVVAAMVFVMLLVAAAGLGIAGVARLAKDRQAARLTVQVADGDAPRILGLLATAPGVARATPVDRADLVRLLRPWLGDDPAATGLPIPAMIDVDLRGPADLAEVERRLRATGAVIRIDRPTRWPIPTGEVTRPLVRLAAALVAILGFATAAVVVLAVRGALATHRETIAVLHMLGATDRQIGWLFQRRVAGEALAGGIVGTTAASAVAAGSALAGDAMLRPVDWAMLAAIPPVVVAGAMLATRLAITRAPGRTP